MHVFFNMGYQDYSWKIRILLRIYYIVGIDVHFFRKNTGAQRSLQLYTPERKHTLLMMGQLAGIAACLHAWVIEWRNVLECAYAYLRRSYLCTHQLAYIVDINLNECAYTQQKSPPSYESRLTLPNEPDEMLFFQCLYHHVRHHFTRGKFKHNNIAQYLPDISLPQSIMSWPSEPIPLS